jgi:putative endonuclease
LFSVYGIRGVANGRLYTGSTSDFQRRLMEHNSDVSTSTKHRGPWELACREDFPALSEALRRERHPKTGKGREELRRILSEFHS